LSYRNWRKSKRSIEVKLKTRRVKLGASSFLKGIIHGSHNELWILTDVGRILHVVSYPEQKWEIKFTNINKMNNQLTPQINKHKKKIMAYMALEIQVLALDRNQNVAGLNRLMGSQPFFLLKLGFKRQYRYEQMIKYLLLSLWPPFPTTTPRFLH
jgi:delta 1-pyrroline-5-carboxylate dehydrogenase